ncbi:MAG: DUF3800 domain-containing protein [Bacteroidales bacterium]
MRKVYAFADEFGNNSFDFEKQGSHFIVGSVIVSEEDLDNLKTQVEAIRKKHFQTGEMKSQLVATNHPRRIKILKELLELNFSIYSVIIDKRKLYGEGFRHKSSFYKYTNGLVYKELFKTFPDLILTVDEHGNNDFMRGFKKYVYRNHIPSLFAQSDFSFGKSPEGILIQLADFIVGTLGYSYDELKKSNESATFLELLRPKITSLNHFPAEFKLLQHEEDKEDLLYNEAIAKLAFNKAKEFIDRSGATSQEQSDQINCLRLLLLYFTSFSHKKYVSTKEIIQHLQVGRNDELKEHYFRTKVIAKLRDSGVLIASSSSGDRKGYKLPSCVNDLHKFVNHGNKMIIPLLNRIKVCRDSIKLVTMNKIDILDQPEYRDLRALIESNSH